MGVALGQRCLRRVFRRRVVDGVLQELAEARRVCCIPTLCYALFMLCTIPAYFTDSKLGVKIACGQGTAVAVLAAAVVQHSRKPSVIVASAAAAYVNAYLTAGVVLVGYAGLRHAGFAAATLLLPAVLGGACEFAALVFLSALSLGLLLVAYVVDVQTDLVVSGSAAADDVYGGIPGYLSLMQLVVLQGALLSAARRDRGRRAGTTTDPVDKYSPGGEAEHKKLRSTSTGNLTPTTQNLFTVSVDDPKDRADSSVGSPRGMLVAQRRQRLACPPTDNGEDIIEVMKPTPSGGAGGGGDIVIANAPSPGLGQSHGSSAYPGLPPGPLLPPPTGPAHSTLARSPTPSTTLCVSMNDAVALSLSPAVPVGPLGPSVRRFASETAEPAGGLPGSVLTNSIEQKRGLLAIPPLGASLPEAAAAARAAAAAAESLSSPVEPGSAATEPQGAFARGSPPTPGDEPTARRSRVRAESRHTPNSPSPVRIITKTLRWKKGPLLGQGGFGKVYLGLNYETGEFMAVKSVEFHPQQCTPEELKRKIQQLNTEIGILAPLDHTHIVKYFFMERADMTINIFMEFVPGGSVSDLLKSFGALEEDTVVHYTYQILVGLAYVHNRGIIHRDLKGANLLITAQGLIKLADFGSAAVVGDSLETVVGAQGTPNWMAPEVLTTQQYTWRADIWSLGCTVMEMLTGDAPWVHLGMANTLSLLQYLCDARTELTFPGSVTQASQGFLRSCLSRDASERPDAQDLIDHHYFTHDAEDMAHQVCASRQAREAEAAGAASAASPRGSVHQTLADQSSMASPRGAPHHLALPRTSGDDELCTEHEDARSEVSLCSSRPSTVYTCAPGLASRPSCMSNASKGQWGSRRPVVDRLAISQNTSVGVASPNLGRARIVRGGAAAAKEAAAAAAAAAAKEAAAVSAAAVVTTPAGGPESPLPQQGSTLVKHGSLYSNMSRCSQISQIQTFLKAKEASATRLKAYASPVPSGPGAGGGEGPFLDTPRGTIGRERSKLRIAPATPAAGFRPGPVSDVSDDVTPPDFDIESVQSDMEELSRADVMSTTVEILAP